MLMPTDWPVTKGGKGSPTGVFILSLSFSATRCMLLPQSQSYPPLTVHVNASASPQTRSTHSLQAKQQADNAQSHELGLRYKDFHEFRCTSEAQPVKNNLASQTSLPQKQRTSYLVTLLGSKPKTESDSVQHYWIPLCVKCFHQQPQEEGGGGPHCAFYLFQR